MAKDKFHGKKKLQDLVDGNEKTLRQRGISLQSEAMKTTLRDSTVEVSKSQILDAFADAWYAQEQVCDNYNISDKRRVKLLEKVLCGPALPDELRPMRPNNPGEAAYYLALREVQDVVTVLVDVLFSELRQSEAERQEAKKEEQKNV